VALGFLASLAGLAAPFCGDEVAGLFFPTILSSFVSSLEPFFSSYSRFSRSYLSFSL